LTGKTDYGEGVDPAARLEILADIDVAAVGGTRRETVHRPIAGVSADDPAVLDADRRPTTTDEIGAVVPSNGDD
jgi:hypothetical protein